MTSTKTVLWQRIQRLMVERWGAENLTRLAREAKVGVATVARIKHEDTSVGLDVLEKVAAALGVQAWQLIAPISMDEQGDPRSLSPLALDLARTLDSITDPAQHHRAYAVASQVISFGVAHSSQQPAETPTDEPSPAL